MDWNDVDAFCCVIEYGGFTAAAKALARPKSSISASVSRLATQLGARLLQRTTRRIRATEAGESLYQDAAPMFQRLREVRSSAAARGNTVAGSLRPVSMITGASRSALTRRRMSSPVSVVSS
jgi:DNA-binding transcriptional LysR family regulator